MMILKPFTIKTDKPSKTSFFAVTTLYIGDIALGYITRNLASVKSSKLPFCFHWYIAIEAEGRFFGDSEEELKEAAINKFRAFICNVLE